MLTFWGACMAISYGTSTSVPTPVETPQNDILDQIALLAKQHADELYKWGQDQYAKTTQLTDQVVHNFLTQSQNATDFAGNAISRYENLFQPQENQLIQDANTYSSQPRIASEMGRSEAESMQGSDAARNNALKDLQSYGVDPSAGRYAALDRMERTQAGAAAAAAGTTARLNTEQTGRNLRSQAIAVGQQYPGQAVNDMNLAIQGSAAAQNASLGNANTGAAVMNLPKGYLDTAMGLKLPPVGQTTRSMQNSSSPNGSGDKQGKDPSDPTGQSRPPTGSAGMPRSSQGSNAGSQKQIYAPGDDGSGGNGGNGGAADQPGALGSSYPPDLSGYDPYNYGDPYAGYGDNSGGSSYGDINNYDPSYYGGTDGFGGEQADTSGFGDYSGVPSYDSTTFSDPNSGASSYDTGGFSDYGDYARGGLVVGGGGHVPRSMSPSGGRQTDDIPAQITQTGGTARLNANEFVIPQDIVAWKGQEYFQKLIAQSRKARVGAPARPTMG